MPHDILSHAYIQHLFKKCVAENKSWCNVPGVTFVMKEMVKHLFHLVLLNALRYSLFAKEQCQEQSTSQVNWTPIYYCKSCDAVIGMLFDVIQF